MNPKYPLRKFIIKYQAESGLFSLWDENEMLRGTDKNGRELGRDAWRMGAEAVMYDYDLGLDETLPLIPLYAKYKTRG